MFKKSFLFAFTALWSIISICAFAAGTVIVSDIDDTLKESHIHSGGGIWTALKTDAFWSMTELFKSAATRPGTKIYYLSNAPRELMEGRHRKFLEVNHFPVGELMLPSRAERDGFKLKTIRAILAKENPDVVIFLGDNGEQDPVVYDTVVRGSFRKGERTAFYTFIRTAYSKKTDATPLRQGQIAFMTGGEVATYLASWSLLPVESARALLSVSALRRGWENRESRYPGVSLGFPDWIDCRDHRPAIPKLNGLQKEAALLEAKILRRCSYVIEE